MNATLPVHSLGSFCSDADGIVCGVCELCTSYCVHAMVCPPRRHSSSAHMRRTILRAAHLHLRPKRFSSILNGPAHHWRCSRCLPNRSFTSPSYSNHRRTIPSACRSLPRTCNIWITMPHRCCPALSRRTSSSHTTPVIDSRHKPPTAVDKHTDGRLRGQVAICAQWTTVAKLSIGHVISSEY